MIEIGHSSQAASGYRSLVRQVERGMARLRRETVLVDMPTIHERMVYTPRTPVPGFVDGERRIVDRTTGKLMRTGTKFRRWVSDRTLPWDSAGGDGDNAPTRPGSARLVIDIPESARFEGAEQRLLFTMWESSKLPALFRPWRPHLLRADTVIVPCEHNRLLMEEALDGAAHRPRVEVVPLGINEGAWPAIDRANKHPDAPFIFLMVGDLGVRKGLDLAYAAFDHLFRDNPRVWLVLKARGMSELATPARYPKWIDVLDQEGAPLWDGDRKLRERNRRRDRYKLEIGDSNVMVLRGDWRRESLLRLYHKADCFLWPSRGEGWGYPPREAAATGLPVITSHHTGLSDAHEWAIPIPTDPTRAHAARYAHWGRSGTFYEPDLPSLIAAMQWVYENRTAALEVGWKGAAWVTGRTEVDVAADILKLIEERETPTA